VAAENDWRKSAFAAIRDLDRALSLRGMDQGRDSIHIIEALKDALGNVDVALAEIIDWEIGEDAAPEGEKEGE
jgi:hypothetical protein